MVSIDKFSANVRAFAAETLPGFEAKLRQKVAPDLHTQMLLYERPYIWKHGMIKDIKLGDYFVHAENLRRNDYEGRRLCDDFSSDGNGNRVGRFKGLQNNIYLRIGDAHVLVMDNHNYAAAFILSMNAKGVIPFGASMVHIDEHDDMSRRGLDFTLKAFRQLRIAKQRHQYLLQNTDIASWQRNPLFMENLVNMDLWRWYSLTNSGSSWLSYDAVGSLPAIYFKGLQKAIGKINYQIMDIDIDVLLPLEKHFSDKDSSLLSKGNVPEQISLKIKEIAQAATNAKVITIATSPGYFNQYRAVIYAKKLVAEIQKVKNHEN